MAVKYKSISAAKKAGSIYYYDKNGTKQLAVTKETLDAWKKKNKGSYKGSSLTAWANAKGKDLKKKEEIQVRKLSPSTVGKGRGDGEMELFQRKVDKRKAKPKQKVAVRKRLDDKNGMPVGIGGLNNQIDAPGAPFFKKAKPKQKVAVKGPVRKGDGTGAGTKTAKKALNNSAESPPQTLKRLEKEMQALQAARTARMDKMKKMKAEAAKLLKDSKPKPSTKEAVEAAMGGNYDSVRTRRSGKFNKKGVGFMEGGMAKKKPSMYNKGGMGSSYSPGGSVAKPMVMKNGKKVPAYAADGVGKMNMGGMAKKKYSYGGLTRSSANNMKKGRG